MKDPAFLFYSKDFYEATRMMLPEERACYIDLLIYQHQNDGYIPNDLKRLVMYCSGVALATLETTLKAKFKLSEKGWYNERLKNITEERKEFTEKQSVNGKVGQFFKRAIRDLSKKDYQKLKSLVSKLTINNQELNDRWLTKINEPKAMLEAMLKHLEDVNVDEDVIENVNNEKDSMKGKTIQQDFTEQKVIYPFDSEYFIEQWGLWKDYKKTEFNFRFKSTQSEQAQLTQLSNLSNTNEQTAIAIIHQSMANGWKGFFELKNNGNGTGKQRTGFNNSGSGYSDDFKRKIAEGLQSG